MDTRPRTLIVYDATDPSLSPLWSLGSMLSRAPGVGVRSWTRLEAEVKAYNPVHMQFWGHGAPGTPLVDGRGHPSLAVMLVRAAPALRQVWWRACNVHRGRLGRRLAMGLTGLGVESVGHCEVISHPWFWRQRAICALRPGDTPWWPDDGEGLRGCSTFRGSVPRWAYP